MSGSVDVKDNLNDAPMTWPDEVFAEISRLGEGAGSMIHKVVKLSDTGVSGELADSPVATFTGTSFYMAVSELLSRYSII